MTLKTRDVERSFLKKGFSEYNNDHKHFVFTYNGKIKSIRTKISHSHSEIGDILISKISNQTYMDKDFLKKFVECTKTESDYIQMLKDKGVIK